MANKVLDSQCPCCGAPIFYNAQLSKWKCEYCDNEFTLEELQKHKNVSSIADTDVQDNFDNYINYHCSNCGAEIIADENTAATFCPYCGNASILQNRLSNQFAPSYIIPFKIPKENAQRALKKLSKGRPLMPKSFNNAQNIAKITGIYIPFWLHDIQIGGSLTTMGTLITTWSSGEYIYTKTDIYKFDYEAAMTYERIPMDGSKRFDDEVMNSLEPFNFAELVPYNHAYLAGYYALKYDVDAAITLENATKRAMNSTIDYLYADMGAYQNKTIANNALQVMKNTHQYVLLPIWMVNVKYRDKMYLFAMNGQTGEFVGDIPFDKGKAILYAILLFVFGFALTIGISYALYLLGVG